MQIEKELITEVKHVESSITKHIAVNDTTKLSSLSAEIVSLKDALNSALNTCQVLHVISILGCILPWMCLNFEVVRSSSIDSCTLGVEEN